MPVKIRLMRIGAKKRPFYRVVAIDERKKRSGAYLELLGTYDPLTEPKQINLKQDRIDEWFKKGAQASNGFLRIIGKAAQKPPRKPKKQKEDRQKEEPKKQQGEETATTEAEKTEKQEPKEQKEETKEVTEVEQNQEDQAKQTTKEDPSTQVEISTAAQDDKTS